MFKVEIEYYDANGQHYGSSFAGHMKDMSAEEINLLLSADLVFHNLGGSLKESTVEGTKYDHANKRLYITMREYKKQQSYL